MTSLYEITTAFAADAQKLAELDLDDQTLADTLEGLQGELQVKAQNTAMVVRNLEALAYAIKDAEERMAQRRKAIENRAKAIRNYILRCMQAGNVNKIESPHLRISRRNNPPHVVVDAPSQVPAEFWVIPEPPPAEISKKVLGEALRAGKEITGAHLEQSERLAID